MNLAQRFTIHVPGAVLQSVYKLSTQSVLQLLMHAESCCQFRVPPPLINQKLRCRHGRVLGRWSLGKSSHS